MKTLKNDIIRWNNTFPLDRWYRKKYNIPFGSPQHLAVSQIDVFFEWYEEILFEEHEKEVERKKEMAEQYAKGNWIIDHRLNLKSTIEEDFDNLDLSQF